MEAGIYIDPADDYEAAAEYCAKWHVVNPMLTKAIRGLVRLPEHVYEDIEANPQDFERRVREYQYGAAME